MNNATSISLASLLFLLQPIFSFAQSNAVSEGDLQAGDLLFFWISEKGRHVGIYLEDQTFLHSSTSEGVTVSKLSDDYWRYRMISARRVDHDITLDAFKQSYARYDAARYSYGSTGPNRFDCSGLVWRIFGNHGVDLPRSTKLQIGYGAKIMSGSDYLARNK